MKLMLVGRRLVHDFAKKAVEAIRTNEKADEGQARSAVAISMIVEGAEILRATSYTRKELKTIFDAELSLCEEVPEGEMVQ